MINITLFRKACIFAEPEIKKESIEHFCKILCETNEVLPFFLLKSNGFRKWPKTNSILKKVAKNYTRPLLMREKTHTFLDTSNHGYADISNQILSLVWASDIERTPGGVDSKPEIKSLLKKISNIRLKNKNFKDNPEIFINDEQL